MVVWTRGWSSARACPLERSRISKIPGVKSIGPSSMRVKNRIVSCSGGLPPSPLPALYPLPGAPLPPPRVCLLPAGALARHHVRVRAALTRVVHRLVHVERELVFRRRFDHVT